MPPTSSDAPPLAARLASYAAAPRDVIARLARDVIEVAEPDPRALACLTAAISRQSRRMRSGPHARTSSRREVPALPSGRAHAVAPPTQRRGSELSELFYAAGSIERRLILINLEYAALQPAAARRPRSSARTSGGWNRPPCSTISSRVAREFERALGISHQQANRMIQDELGEPIVVAAKAMALPSDVLQRMLLFVNPQVGQSIDRVYELAELYDEITVDAARRLIAILRDADPAEYRPAGTNRSAWRNAAGERATCAVRDRPHRPADGRRAAASR